MEAAASSQAPPPPPPPPARAKRARGLLSCTECHRRKQKCDRRRPCDSCTARGVSATCDYQQPPPRPRPRAAVPANAIARRRGAAVHVFSDAAVEALARVDDVPPVDGHGDGDPLPDAAEEPLPLLLAGLSARPFLRPSAASPAMADIRPQYLRAIDPLFALPESSAWVPRKALIYYFVHKLVPWLVEFEDRGPDASPKLSWLPDAVHHPALYHATLLVAAVHLARTSPAADPRLAFGLKAETLRLVNARLDTAVEGPSDEMICTVLILLYYSVGDGDLSEYDVHLNGIHQMLRLRGGSHNTQMRGIVSNWLSVCFGPWHPDWSEAALA